MSVGACARRFGWHLTAGANPHFCTHLTAAIHVPLHYYLLGGGLIPKSRFSNSPIAKYGQVRPGSLNMAKWGIPENLAQRHRPFTHVQLFIMVDKVEKLDQEVDVIFFSRQV